LLQAAKILKRAEGVITLVVCNPGKKEEKKPGLICNLRPNIYSFRVSSAKVFISFGTAGMFSYFFGVELNALLSMHGSFE